MKRNMRVALAIVLALMVVGFAACGDEPADTQSATPAAGETAAGDQTTEDASTAGESGPFDVVGTDYAFSGIPDTLAAGATTFNFENQGKEPHEMVVFRFKSDKYTFEELFAMGEKKAMKFIEPAGGTFAKPGETAKKPLEADLVEGRYVAVCFIPTKTDKKPHALHGMIHEFEVTA